MVQQLFLRTNPVFHFNRTVAKRPSFCEHSGRTNDTGTKGYATFRCDTVEVEDGLYGTLIQHISPEWLFEHDLVPWRKFYVNH